MPSSGDLPDPGIKPVSLISPALASGSLPLSRLGSPQLPALGAHNLSHWITREVPDNCYLLITF